MPTLKLLDQSRDVAGPIGDLVLPLDGPPDAPGSSVRLSTLRGRMLVLLILGVNCKTCQHVATMLSMIRFEYSPEVDFFGICVQAECRDKLADFATGAEIYFPLTFCRTRELCPALGISVSTWLFYPTLIFIDQEQRLRGVFVAGDPFFTNVESNVRLALDELLAEASIGTTVEAVR